MSARQLENSMQNLDINNYDNTTPNSDDVNITRKIFVNKHRKKQAANDAQLLMNRIALLQKEEERARKKVEQTKERAEEVLAMREDNDRRMHEVTLIADMERKIKEEAFRKNFELEEESRMLKVKHIDEQMMRRRESVEKLRDMKLKHRFDIIKEKQDDVKKKQAQAVLIKQREFEAKLKREKEKLDQERKIKEYYESKVKAEDDEARRAEALVKALERKEREWIDKLREAQQDQEVAFVELEQTLQKSDNLSPGATAQTPMLVTTAAASGTHSQPDSVRSSSAKSAKSSTAANEKKLKIKKS